MTNHSGRTVARWLSRPLLAVGLLVGVLGSAAAPAVAGPAVQRDAVALAADCPFTNTLCLFSGTNYTGERFTARSPVAPGVCVSLVDHGWGDRARSAINTSSTSASMFMNDDCVGGPYQIPAGTSLPNFGTFTPESIWVSN
ncbi:peptidase inhibitor family I36 protein [Plantactinospora sp. CA-290183]|uniref:peptidase inhibitor family I36 protein n=1 Tax=Plantactinospora sp. CA-290183 TaxID=3240006 RepID=UPI003D8FEE86